MPKMPKMPKSNGHSVRASEVRPPLNLQLNQRIFILLSDKKTSEMIYKHFRSLNLLFLKHTAMKYLVLNTLNIKYYIAERPLPLLPY